MQYNLPETMKGIRLTGHGGPERLELQKDIPVPKPGPTDVLIRVSAAAVNNTDINTRIGWYSKNDHAAEDAAWGGTALQFPRIQGADVCGRIVSVGTEIDATRIGERVLVEPCLREIGGNFPERPGYFGSEVDGGFAEYAVVAARHAHAVDSPLTDIELASFPCSYSTAENLLTRSGVTAGDRVLITGASGGVGSAAIQLARARKAHVTAMTSPGKEPDLIRLGADRILYRDSDLMDQPGRNAIDVVIDLVGGDSWSQLPEVLVPGGRYAVSGAIAGPVVPLDLRTLYLKDLKFFGCTVLDPYVFANLIRRIEKREISPVIFQTFPLEAIREAQALFLEKHHIGKIVLTIPR